MTRPTIAILGASADRSKYGNRAIHSYRGHGYDVYPVNPKEEQIEGLKSYRSILDVPVRPDRVSIYLPPAIGIKIIEEVAQKGAGEVFLNPGSESDELIQKAEGLGLKVVVACSITDVESR